MDIRQSAFFSIISQLILNAISLALVICTARLLTPEEVGIYAIASSLVFIAAELKSMGVGSYIVKEKHLTQTKFRLSLGLSMLVSWTLGVLVLIFASSIQAYYNVKDLDLILYILTINFFISPFLVNPNAMLRRNFEFDKVLIVRFFSQFLSFVATIGLILLDFSYFSLAIGCVLMTALEFIVMYILKQKYFTFTPQITGIKEIFKFGVLVSSTNMLHRMSLVIPDLIIGKVISPASAAIYSRGQGFTDFLSGTISMGIRPLILPYFSNVNNEGGDVTKSYLRASALMLSMLWPALIVAGVASYPIVLFMFGDQWLESVEIVTYLCWWMILRNSHILSLEFFISLKHENYLLIKVFVVFITIAACLYIGASDGLLHVARMMLLAGVIEFLITSLLLYLAIGLTITKYLKAVSGAIILSIICGSATYALSDFYSFTENSPIQVISYIAILNLLLWSISAKLLKLDIYQQVVLFVFKNKNKAI